VPRIEVVRATDLKPGNSTRGIVRGRAFESGDVLVSQSRLDAGAISDWHHHGARRLYGFLASGHLRLEYGPNGTEAADVRAGDFFHVPPRLVHRDVNPSQDQGSVVVAILVGRGLPVVNVGGP
jgi:uncharacterized RmlC-like cupin family protein